MRREDCAYLEKRVRQSSSDFYVYYRCKRHSDGRICEPNYCLSHSEMKIEEYKLMDEEKRLHAQKLYEHDRCNFCYHHNFCYKRKCDQWNVTCFPNFIEEEEMEL